MPENKGKVTIVTRYCDAISTAIPGEKQYACYDKQREKPWYQSKTSNKLKGIMSSLGGQTRDRLRKKLDAKLQKS